MNTACCACTGVVNPSNEERAAHQIFVKRNVRIRKPRNQHRAAVLSSLAAFVAVALICCPTEASAQTGASDPALRDVGRLRPIPDPFAGQRTDEAPTSPQPQAETMHIPDPKNPDDIRAQKIAAQRAREYAVERQRILAIVERIEAESDQSGDDKLDEILERPATASPGSLNRSYLVARILQTRGSYDASYRVGGLLRRKLETASRGAGKGTAETTLRLALMEADVCEDLLRDTDAALEIVRRLEQTGGANNPEVVQRLVRLQQRQQTDVVQTRAGEEERRNRARLAETEQGFRENDSGN